MYAALGNIKTVHMSWSILSILLAMEFEGKQNTAACISELELPL